MHGDSERHGRSGSVDSVLRGRSGLSPVMVGRVGALDRLLGLVEAAEVMSSNDGPQIALVSGEAGIGKTRLLREFVAALPPGVEVLTAHAQPGSLGRPFDVLGQLCEPGVDPAAATMAKLAIAVGRSRVVLIVEDLHWADADSVHVLEQIAQQPWPQLVLVGTVRPGDLSRMAPGGELLLRLERQHTVEQIRLERLDRAEISALLAAIRSSEPSSAAVDAVFRRSGGIPFIAEELLRGTAPDYCSDDLLSAQLPWSLDEAVRQQLSGLGAQQRRVIDVLAVFGDPAPFEILALVSELDEATLLDALRELVDREIVVEASEDTFWFSHALIADAIQQQLLGRERRRLHERSLTALRSMPNADHASLARHALGAGHFEQIPGIAREGVRLYLARGASFQALRLASAALDEAPDDPELLGVATDAAWRLQFTREAIVYARRWVDVAITDIDRVEARRFVARLSHELGDRQASEDALAELITLAESLMPGLARGRSYGAVAQIHMIMGRTEAAIEWADRAIEEARRNGDEWLLAQASVERSSSTLHDTDLATAERGLLQAREAARSVGDGVLECRALNNLLSLVGAQSQIGEWARDELRIAARSCGFDKLGSAMVALWEAEAAIARADMRAARQWVAEAGQFWGPGSQEFHFFLSELAELRIEEGLTADALATVVRLDELQDQDDSHKRGGSRIRLIAAGLTNDRQLATAAFAEQLSRRVMSNYAGALSSLVDLVLVSLLAGIHPTIVRRDMVAGWIAEHNQRAAVDRHVEGLLLLSEGDPVGALAALEAVLATPDPLLDVPVRASLRLALASARIATGDRQGALQEAMLAKTELALWPGWRRDRAEALIRRLAGAGGRSAAGELTSREREVAALLAEGLTNSQVAERLYISPRTAAVHVSNILMKLGLSGRAEIAAWAVRHDVLLEAS